jgi:hypothetical protein
VVYSYAIKEVREAQKKWEKTAAERAPLIDEYAIHLYEKDPSTASKFLTDYCNNNAKLVIDAWWDLGDYLLVRFNHLWNYDVRERKRKALEYPDWWLKLLVEYNKLEPVEEKKD